MPDAQRAADICGCRKEADMNTQKLTILYERISVDDGTESESNSIQNQRQMLQDYAERNNLTPYIHLSEACVIIEPTQETA